MILMVSSKISLLILIQTKSKETVAFRKHSLAPALLFTTWTIS